MDAKYLAEIRARCEATEDGPWKSIRTKVYDFYGDRCGSGRTYKDAAFISHSRADIPALLAEVERLTQENSSLEKEYRHYIRLSEKLDQQIVTLKKALQIVFTEFGRYLPHDMDYFIHQAQEQVGKIG